ncbi:putative N-acetyltransferase, MSMEG_0567 N-terminal domain family [Asanoa hainanensis]|uniref:Putative N-acetyltransferase, MSMEG_0567 N-terminal domain family n=1 Tax=Asanoa hainanensis TaxID=560556 RepID=A0A239GNZ2_9ACTN|nr:MSMEG_0567/Sll0786 family nitrogen starvation N-acetyltransferase [Asanoa hainanensis]SNS70850.1 putative N-acetyltransferase, MSMEG_0567 N-terminal domain family [Asanoa hainanensis]
MPRQAERLRIGCRVATSAADLAAHHAVRHRVFVAEQHIFAGSDRDAHDARPSTIPVIGDVDGTIGGSVRLFPLDAAGRRWQGDRLAVLPEFRAYGLGAPLVRFAVDTAGARGGSVMVAHIQLANVRFFERLGWHRDGDLETYAGLPHQPMAIDLGRGPR